MSLSVYLKLEGATSPAGSGIFVREAERVREITRAEWDEKFPGREPVVVEMSDDDPCVFSANITRNLGEMAGEAGIYKYLWRPEEVGVTRAYELIKPLEAGLEMLKSDPERFSFFNPSNGWWHL